jgi:hypothetical protein
LPTIQIYSNNFIGQTGYLIFYPQTGGTINIGTVTLPYNYNTEYYYGTFVINFSGFSRTCNLEILAPSPTPTVTPTITPSSTQPPSCDVLVGFVTPTPTPSLTPTITPTITLTPTPSSTPNPSIGCNCYYFTNESAINRLLQYVDCITPSVQSVLVSGYSTYSTCVSGNSFTASSVSLVPHYIDSCISGQCPVNISANNPLLLLNNSNEIYEYNLDVSQYTVTPLSVPSMPTYAVNISHTSNKLFVLWSTSTYGGGENIREYNLNLSPFSASVVSDYFITGATSTFVAFCAKDNDTFILWRQTSPPSVSEYSISSSTRTFIYNVPSIADSVSSINLTQNNKLLIKGANKIYQMDYASGNLEMSATTLGSPPIVPNIGGMFEYSGNIYVMGNLSSRVVNYPLTNPFLPKVLYANLPISVKNVSQIRTYLTVDFIP